jgi:50S ribosomal subunit-associated GTPase HflX
VQLSAKSRADVSELRDKLIELFAGKLEETELVVPWTAQRMVNQIHERTTVLNEAHDDQGTTLKVRAPERVLEDLREQLRTSQ